MAQKRDSSENARDRDSDRPAEPVHSTAIPAEALGAEAIEVSEQAAELFRQLTMERDDAVAGRKRALADFANYQRRALENEDRAARNASSRFARALVPVLDNFDLALNQRAEQMSVQTLLKGVHAMRDDFRRILESQGVTRIEPVVGEAFDPNRHEAMMRQPATEEVPPDAILSVLQPGYTLGDMVLRPAKVIIAGA